VRFSVLLEGRSGVPVRRADKKGSSNPLGQRLLNSSELTVCHPPEREKETGKGG